MGSNDPAGLLRNVLRANAVFSLGCGIAFLVASPGLGSAFGLAPSALVAFGAVLLGFALHLWKVASCDPVSPGAGLYFLLSDVLYVVASVVVLFGFPGALSSVGRLFFSVAADFVAVFATLEYVGLRRLRGRSQTEGDGRADSESLV